MGRDNGEVRIAYFTNQYPAPSHTFIKREIIALEARGHSVQRYAVRPFHSELKDAEDVREAGKTRQIFETSPRSAAASVLRMMLARPAATWRAFKTSFRFGAAAGGKYLVHLIYFMEALILADWCRRDGIEHLHVHFGTNPATVATLAHEICGVRFSFTVHGPEEFDRPEALGLRDKIRASAFVVGVSSYGRSQLLRWAHLDDWKKVKVVHCGIDQFYSAEQSEAIGSERRLVCIARLSEQKGHFLLLQAAAKLKADGLDFQLVLVGDGPLRAEIEAQILRFGLGDVIRLTGTMAQEDVRSEILSAKAMVLPSFAEGLPVVLMESLALKRPVIATYIAGIPELVQPENGWLVPAGDVDALAQAMQAALLASDIELADKGEAGRRRTLARHDVHRSAAILEELMQQPTTA